MFVNQSTPSPDLDVDNSDEDLERLTLEKRLAGWQAAIQKYVHNIVLPFRAISSCEPGHYNKHNRIDRLFERVEVYVVGVHTDLKTVLWMN